MPVRVAITITNRTKTTVFFIPITEPITSIFGKDKAGPAKSKANAGPFPIPLPIRACKIGISVRVAKYIKAPTTEANRTEPNELPPTKLLIHSDGIKPSWPGRPSSNPATSTPPSSKGIICLVNPQVCSNHWRRLCPSPERGMRIL